MLTLNFRLNIRGLPLLLGLLIINSISEAQNNGWNEVSSLTSRRWGHTSIVQDDHIYLIGGMQGFNLSGEVPANSLWRYNPLTEGYETLDQMEFGRALFSAQKYNGNIYVIGGAKRVFGNTTLINTIEAYDPNNDSWTTISELPTSRFTHIAKIINQKLYVIGGATPNWEPIGQVDIYNMETDTWISGTPMPTPRASISAVVINEKIYTIGGHQGTSTNESGEKLVEVYDASSDSWTTISEMPIKVKMSTASVYEDKIYVFGGAEGYCTPAIAAIQVYDLVNGTWSIIEDMPEELAWSSSVQHNGKIYLSGGLSGNCTTYSIKSTMYEFDPSFEVTSLDKSNGFHWKVYPNPAKDYINIQFDTIKPYKIEIFNNLGQQLLLKIANTPSKSINISKLPKGIYMLKLTSRKRYIREQIILN